MKNIDKLLEDNLFLSELLNGPCRPYFVAGEPFDSGKIRARLCISADKLPLGEKNMQFQPFFPSCIDENVSQHLMKSFQNLRVELPGFATRIVAERHLVNHRDETIPDGWRYIVISVCPLCKGEDVYPMVPIVLNYYWNKVLGGANSRIDSVNLYIGNCNRYHIKWGNSYMLMKMKEPVCRELITAYRLDSMRELIKHPFPKRKREIVEETFKSMARMFKEEIEPQNPVNMED